MGLFSKIFGDANSRMLKKLEPEVAQINELEPEIEKLSNEELRAKTEEFKERLEEGEELDDLLHEAFACAREVAKRTLGQRHYDVQLLGGIVLHQGKIAEMRTGEGKTLAATAPVYLNALSGNGVHVVTVNDYLAKRDAVWMGQVYDALGMSVACVTQEGAFQYDKTYVQEVEGEKAGEEEVYDKERDEKGSFKVIDEFLRPVEKREAYACDIVYGTNNEFGFDYLRDSMALSKEQLSQRDHAFVIIDEVDSVLIDEARTPLIISAPDTEAPQHYQMFAKIAPRLKENEDYNIDEKRKAVLVTEEGVKKVEQMLGLGNLYEEGLRLVHYLEQALRAQVLYHRDRDYVVRDGEVVIVDEFTGRLMPGRRWSEGLHQAVEAKEGVKLQAESRTLATITFQNYFRMYDKLSGMTGTAATSAEEFWKVYQLEVAIIPTHKPMIRDDRADLVLRTQEGKFRALARMVREKHDRGQPVLIGTTSIQKNELVSEWLSREGIPHEMLNAKNHEKEGAIIAQAGRRGAVTVATNMAGRGVDIILGGTPPDKDEAQAVKDLGGLSVVGTERHDARRIDNQLRGRAGRQGDPGETQFLLSLEDDLLRIFASERVQKLMSMTNVPEDQPLESRMVSKAIESAQSRIEGHNFDARKHLLEYDDVMNKQREAIYRKRRAVLEGEGEEALEQLAKFFDEELEAVAVVHLGSEYVQEWNIEEFMETLKALLSLPDNAHAALLALSEGKAPEEGKGDPLADLKDVNARRDAILTWAHELFEAQVENRREELEEEMFLTLAKQVILRSVDALWVEHLENMEALRDEVRLRGYGQRDPLVEYKREARRVFESLQASIRARAVQMFFRAQVHRHAPREQQRVVAHRGAVMATSPQDTAGGQQSGQAARQAAPVRKKKDIGRNDPCPCGTIDPNTGRVYKYKKCGLIDAPHHKG